MENNPIPQDAIVDLLQRAVLNQGQVDVIIPLETMASEADYAAFDPLREYMRSMTSVSGDPLIIERDGNRHYAHIQLFAFNSLLRHFRVASQNTIDPEVRAGFALLADTLKEYPEAVRVEGAIDAENKRQPDFRHIEEQINRYLQGIDGVKHEVAIETLHNIFTDKIAASATMKFPEFRALLRAYDEKVPPHIRGTEEAGDCAVGLRVLDQFDVEKFIRGERLSHLRSVPSGSALKSPEGPGEGGEPGGVGGPPTPSEPPARSGRG